MGEWYNPLTWFDSWGSGGSSNDFPTSGAIDWNLGGNTQYTTPGMSDADVKSWNDYVTIGGTMVPNWYPNYAYSGGTTTNTDTTSSDFDLGDIFGNITDAIKGIGGVFNTGLQAYANVQQLINAQNPQDQLVRPQGSNMVYVQRGTDLIPLQTAYPQIFGGQQFQQAQQQDMFNSIFKFGALALGGVLLFKLVDKKK